MRDAVDDSDRGELTHAGDQGVADSRNEPSQGDPIAAKLASALRDWCMSPEKRALRAALLRLLIDLN